MGKLNKKQRELQRILNIVAREEKQGYRFSGDYINQLKNKSLSELKHITPNELLKNATALSDNGKVVTGVERKQEERLSRRGFKRRKAIKKHGENSDKNTTINKKQTRKEKKHTKWLQTRVGKLFQENQNSVFSEKRERVDREQQKTYKAFNENDIVYYNVKKLINEYPSEKGSQYLRNLLLSEIKRYGEDAVITAMQNAPYDMVNKAQNIVFMPSDQETAQTMHDALSEFADIINSCLPTTNEAKEIGDLLHSEESYDTLI